MKAKFGAIITDGIGKLGGATITKSRQGTVIKNKMSRVNGLSSSQVTMRQRINVLSKAWAALLESERVTWSVAAKDYTQKNVFGDQVLPSGYNLFLKVNLQLLLINQAIINTAPVKGSIISIESASAVVYANITNFLLSFTPPVPGNYIYKVYASKPVPASICYCSSLWKFVGILDSSALSPYDLSSLYIDKFCSNGEEGMRIFVKIIPVSIIAGIEYLPFIFSTIIQNQPEMYKASIILTPTDIINCLEVEIIPAQGAGTVIIPICCNAKLKFNATPYSATGAKIYVGYQNAGGFSAVMDGDYLEAGNDCEAVSLGVSNGWYSNPNGSFENQRLKAYADGIITGGDSSIFIDVYYIIGTW